MGIKDWVIKVVCTQKHPMKTWQNANGGGCYMSVDFHDCLPPLSKKSHYDTIQVTFFKECAQNYESLIEQDKTYYISNG
jgi:hypothetical protein